MWHILYHLSTVTIHALESMLPLLALSGLIRLNRLFCVESLALQLDNLPRIFKLYIGKSHYHCCPIHKPFIYPTLSEHLHRRLFSLSTASAKHCMRAKREVWKCSETSLSNPIPPFHLALEFFWSFLFGFSNFANEYKPKQLDSVQLGIQSTGID